MSTTLKRYDKNIKIKYLQYRYNYISTIIYNLNKHIEYIYFNNIINESNKNKLIHFLYEILQELNNSYNKYISEKLNNVDHIDKIFNIFNEISFENIILLLEDNSIIPLYNIENKLLNYINENGYNSIIELLKILKINYSNNTNILLTEINNIFIPTHIVELQNNIIFNNIEYYWKTPDNFDKFDLLELMKELYIYSNNKYIKISGYFINDNINFYVKTSQINYNIFDNNRNQIINKYGNLINKDFLYKIINYDYIGYIYTLHIDEYIKHIEKLYAKYVQLINMNLVNIIKYFTNEKTNIKNMYITIFLLLLGNDNNINMASILFSLLKEKNKNNISIKDDNYNFIYNLFNKRLSYYLLLKIKKSNNNINKEINKIKSNMNNNLDFKKQLIINTNIPNNIKYITLEKIEEMGSFNNDYYKQLTFVKHIINYPWNTNDELNLNKLDKKSSKEYLLNIKDKLFNLSYGHEEAKKELLHTIAKWISNPNSQGTCFGLVGPPGVGKTLLAKSIGKALDIPFSEITLGGQNDGELLYGHGYTYSGSQPGLIIKKMVDMGKSRCILYFDELDKACSKNGSINEITSILIHLTDPNMNKTFQDRFFQGIDFPLDKVIIIFSYNDPSLIDPILLDRLKQIFIKPYTTIDKIKIVKNFIIPELSQSIGIKDEWINIDDELIKFIVENYTNEAGVRSIKRHIEQIFLTLNLDKILEKNEFNNSVLTNITKDIIIRILDVPINKEQIINDDPQIGIINGLYTNLSNGGIIQIQIFNNYSSESIYDIKLTGKQGDVMKESIECSLTVALNYINNNLDKYSITKEQLNNIYKCGLHVHIPYTSVPKDGPSAGSAFTLAFISRLLNKKIKNNIAVTGEIDLLGKITQIGGLTFKLIGAKKAGINQVFIPLENKLEYFEMKNKNSELFIDFNITMFDNITEIIDLILLD
jgi:endopeptidase La